MSLSIVAKTANPACSLSGKKNALINMQIKTIVQASSFQDVSACLTHNKFLSMSAVACVEIVLALTNSISRSVLAFNAFSSRWALK